LFAAPSALPSALLRRGGARLDLDTDRRQQIVSKVLGHRLPVPQHDKAGTRAMPRAIVISTYRYKRPPRKKKPVLLEVPAIVVKRVLPSQPAGAPKPAAPANDDRKSAIVTARRPGGEIIGRGHGAGGARQRGDAADALFREIVRRATAKD
jgi:hypothetical protein